MKCSYLSTTSKLCGASLVNTGFKKFDNALAFPCQFFAQVITRLRADIVSVDLSFFLTWFQNFLGWDLILVDI